MTQLQSMTICSALNLAHQQLMDTDDRVVVIGEDVGSGVFGVTAGLTDSFGASRVINTPISETAFMGMATGAALTGLKPIVEIMFCDFMGVCFDQIVNQAAKMRFLSGDRMQLPLVIRTTMGAGDGSGAMHSQSLHGLLAHIPGLVVACPSTPQDAAGLLKAGLSYPDPVVILEHKGLYDNTLDTDPALPPVTIGEGRVVREGSDLTLVAVSAMVPVAMKAAEQLAKNGISVEIIDPRTIQPLDWGLINESLRKTGHLLVLDEGPEIAGFADVIVSRAATEGFAYLKKAPAKVTPPHASVPYAPALEKAYLPTVESVLEATKQLLECY